MQVAHASPDPRTPLPYPNGWFAACFTHELKRGKVLTVSFMGRDLVLYRTESGEARAITPYCPHLGAHLGHGGRIEGENLVCPFHGFVYGQDGRCLRTGTGQQPPQASLDLQPIREVLGLVFVWHHHAGAPPDWELPEFDAADSSRLGFSSSPMSGYLQDLAENTADAAHVQFVHKLGPSYKLSSYVAEGHTFKFHLGDFFGLGFKLQPCCHGLGVVIAEGRREDLGLEFRVVIAASPRGPLRWDFMHTLSCQLSRPRMVPAAIRRIATSTLIALGSLWLKGQSAADAPIWNHRTYLEHPMLTKEDQSFVIFRRWAKQFYPPAEVQPPVVTPAPEWREPPNRTPARTTSLLSS